MPVPPPLSVRHLLTLVVPLGLWVLELTAIKPDKPRLCESTVALDGFTFTTACEWLWMPAPDPR